MNRVHVAIGAVLWAIAIAAGSIHLGIPFHALLLAVMAVAAVAMAGLVAATVRLNRGQHQASAARHAHIQATGGYRALAERAAAETTV